MRNYLLVLLLLPAILHGQDFTNKGKDFWIGYGNHVRMFSNNGPSTVPEQMQLYITADGATSGTVTIPGISFSQPFTITANQVTTVDIPRSAALLNEGKYNLGIHVTALKPVVVYSFIYVNAISGATVCLPTSTLGKEYYSLNYTQVSNEPNSYSYFFVVATDTGTTTVALTPSRNSLGGLVANTTTNVTLTQGQVYQVLSPLDLTGSYIQSVSSGLTGCKKIAVFSGSGKIAIGCGNQAGTSDNLYQQMYPVSTWGKEYVTVPSINTADRSGQTNFYRILTSDPAANVRVNGIQVSFGSLGYYEFSNSQTNYIQSDKPILAAQYFTSQGCSGNKGSGDPEMIFLNPLEQTVASVTLNSMQPSSGTNINEHYINTVLPNAPGAINSFRVDGVAVSNFMPVTQHSNYVFAQIPVSRGTHNITCDSGFNAIAYGFGNAESYGYSAGTNLKDLYQFISVSNKYAVVNFPAACKNSPLAFSMTFPYQPLQIKWQFSGLFPDTTIAAPVYDSVWTVNSKTLYRYSLNKSYSVTATGTYPVKVIATSPGVDGCGGEQEINYDLQVFDRPVVADSYTNNGCLTDPVIFHDSTGNNGRPVVRYSWDFGDGTVSAVNNPVHSYTAGGTYPVKFSVITDIGCVSDTLTQLLNISGPPVARFKPDSITCLGNSIRFTDLSTTAAINPLAAWKWSFGDSSTLNKTDSLPVQHRYPAAGNYTVSLQVFTAGGCSSTVASRLLTISPVPVANFTEPAICLNDPVARFTDSSFIPGVATPSLSYAWQFGNGDSSVQQNGSTHYGSTGVYTVSLSVTSAQGCKRDTTKLFTVNGAVPKAAFTVMNQAALCSNTAVAVTDASSVDFGKIVRTEIYWDYLGNPLDKTVDSFPAIGATYLHRYADFGSPASKTYQLRYVVYSGISCINETFTSITVKASPQLQFDSLAPVCAEVAPFMVSAAHDLSVFAATGNYSGKGISAAGIFTPSVAGPGQDSLTYSVIAPDGCRADTGRVIIIYPSPVVSAGPDKFLLEGGTVTLDGTSTGSGLSYNWAPPTFLSNPRSATPVVSATADMVYTLKVVTADGCFGTDDVKVTVLKKIKVPNAFSPNGDGVNDRWMIQYLESYPGCRVDVYNRYGQVVFHSIGYTTAWDGSLNGQPLPVGTYYWIITPMNGRSPENGSVTIIR